MNPASTSRSMPWSSSQLPMAASRASRSGWSALSNTAASMPAAAARSSPRAPARLEPTQTTSTPSRPWTESSSACRLVPSPDTSTPTRERHYAAVWSTGYGPDVVEISPASISSSTRARMSARRMCDDVP